MNSTSKIIQTPFEKAVFDVVNYLVDNYAKHQIFRHKKELIENDFGIKQKTWSVYEAGLRNIPKSKISHITKVLEEKYLVNGNYLRQHKGSMFLTAAHIVNEEAAHYSTSHEIIKQLREEMAIIKKELEQLKEEKKLVDDIAEMQRELIVNYKKQLAKEAENTAQINKN